MSYTYEYPHPALTVDAVVFGVNEKGLQILLIRRKDEPFRGHWALPGGFVNIDESCPDAVRRELQEETGITNVYLEQLYTFSEPNRDPRERVVDVAYYALVRPNDLQVTAGSDAKEAQWYPIQDAMGLPLAFDHAAVITTGLVRLVGKVRYQPIGFELLPKKFTLNQLQKLYEAILQRPLDKRNFRRKILRMGILTKLKEISEEDHPSRLYEFDQTQYNNLLEAGFNFEV